MPTLTNALERWQGLWPSWLVNIAFLALAAFLLLFLHSLLFHALRLALRGRLAEFGRKLLHRIGPPTRLGLLVLGLGLVVQVLPRRGPSYDLFERALLFGFITFLGWSAITIVNTASEIYLRRALRGSEDRCACCAGRSCSDWAFSLFPRCS